MNAITHLFSFSKLKRVFLLLGFSMVIIACNEPITEFEDKTPADNAGSNHSELHQGIALDYSNFSTLEGSLKQHINVLNTLENLSGLELDLEFSAINENGKPPEEQVLFARESIDVPSQEYISSNSEIFLDSLTFHLSQILTPPVSTMLNEYFISIIAGNDGYGHKPNTLPFEETLKRMGSAANETLVIGDSHVDIEAGKAAGCYTCLFAPALNAQFHDVKQLKSMNADIEISEISALLKYI